MRLKQILIVDDDPEDREIILDAMKLIHDQDIIMFAENGEQALDILHDRSNAKQLPCLVVLDLNMPRMNGTETLKIIKNREEFRDVQIIIYSTSVNPVEKDRCLQLGASDFITKPISFEESKSTAKKFLAFCRINSGE